MNTERDFKGVWIPKDLWLDKTLKPIHKFFLIEIDSLDSKKGCIASNAHFSQLFGVTKGRCTQIIKELEAKGLIKIHLFYEGKMIKRRAIEVVNKLNRGSEKIKQGYLINAEGTNTIITNTNKENNKESLFEEFWELYPRKIAKKNALRSWCKLRPQDKEQAIVYMNTYPFSEVKEERFIPHAATFINGERWNDGVQTQKEETYI